MRPIEVPAAVIVRRLGEGALILGFGGVGGPKKLGFVEVVSGGGGGGWGGEGAE